MAEKWKRVSDHPGFEVSDRGRVRRRLTTGGVRQVSTWFSEGYVYTSLAGTRVAVHRLVCRAWHGAPPEESTQVDHRNRVRDDNRPHNLAWVSPRENARRVHAPPICHAPSPEPSDMEARAKRRWAQVRDDLICMIATRYTYYEVCGVRIDYTLEQGWEVAGTHYMRVEDAVRVVMDRSAKWGPCAPHQTEV